MKSIEEAAKEFAEENEIIKTKDAFKAGVAFAQQCHSVEEEGYPEIDKENPHKLYLVKVIEGSITPKEIITVAYLRNRCKWSCEMDWVRVISWRPINIE